MARVAGGVGCSHVPAVGAAIDKGRTEEPYWAPYFAKLDRARRWIAEVDPDVCIVVYNDHASAFSLEVIPTFALGLAEDVVAGGPLGLHAVSKAALGFAVGDLPRWFLVGKPVVAIAAVALATVADGAIRFALLQLFHYPAPFDELLARVILPQAGYNAMLASLAVLAPVSRARP